MSARSSASGPAQDARHDMLPALLAKPHVLVMGVLNITPDSFFDGGEFLDPARALAQAEQLVADGADILDIGAESTRPYGAKPIAADEEIARLAPVLPAIARLSVPISIDTMKASVAAWALDQGAAILNDVWGLHRDSAMATLAAERGAPIVVMHNRDEADPAIDIMKDIVAFFERSLAIADTAGLSRDSIVLDPGIGFGKTPEQSMIALARLDELTQFGRPILVGASRKRFIASVSPSEPRQRIGGSLAAHLLAVQNSARIIRAHDVFETVQALRVAAAIGDKR